MRLIFKKVNKTRFENKVNNELIFPISLKQKLAHVTRTSSRKAAHARDQERLPADRQSTDVCIPMSESRRIRAGQSKIQTDDNVSKFTLWTCETATVLSMRDLSDQNADIEQKVSHGKNWLQAGISFLFSEFPHILIRV